jgi:hypothetical protein
MVNGALSRRAFLERGAMVAAGAATAVALSGTTAFAQDTAQTEPTFALAPSGGACNACRGHATNKLFRTEDAANAFRAHNGCRCTTTKGQTISPPVFAAVFGDAGQSADRRDKRTAELLDKGTVDGVPVPVMAATAPVLLLAAGGGIWWWMRHHDKKSEPATVEVDQAGATISWHPASADPSSGRPHDPAPR